MRKIIHLSVIVILTVLLTAGAVSAITIGFDPVFQEVEVGSPVEVALFISGLGDKATPSLSTFDVDISFNPTILAFDMVIYGDPSLGDQLDLFGLGFPLTITTPSVGSVRLMELSLNDPDVLNNYQVASFTLAVLTFDTLALGTSPLNIVSYTLGDANGNPLTPDLIKGKVNVVPEPGTFLLVASGLAGFRSLRRKFPMRP